MIQVGRINYGMDHFRETVLETKKVVHMVIKCFRLINWLEIEPKKENPIVPVIYQK